LYRNLHKVILVFIFFLDFFINLHTCNVIIDCFSHYPVL